MKLRRIFFEQDQKEAVGQKIKLFIDSLNTWFDLEEDAPGFLMYATDENKSIESYTAGEKDINEARRIVLAVKKKFASRLRSVGFYRVEEWVHIEIEYF